MTCDVTVYVSQKLVKVSKCTCVETEACAGSAGVSEKKQTKNKHIMKSTLTSPSFVVQEVVRPPLSSPPGFTELAYI